jgi:hypothetical protein
MTMLEEMVRGLRDKVYSVPASDGEWEKIKRYWMLPTNVNWLQAKSKQPLKHYGSQ